MPVPPLQVSYPDPAGSYAKTAQIKNYLTVGRLAEQRLASAPMEQRLKEAQIQNYLVDNQRSAEKFEWEKQQAATKSITDTLHAIKLLTELPDKGNMEILAEKLGFKGYKWTGPKTIRFTLPDNSELEGSPGALADMANAGLTDPSWFSNEEVSINVGGVPTKVPKRVLFDQIAIRSGISHTKPASAWTPKSSEEKKEILGLEEDKARVRAKYRESDKPEKTYETDKSKQIDDTRAYYSAKAKLILDPDTGLVRQGPAGDPDKYTREYNELMRQMKTDMVRIDKGKKPTWLTEEEAAAEKPKTEEMSAMPDAASNKGRTIKDTETGKRYKSDGSKWMEIK